MRGRCADVRMGWEDGMRGRYEDVRMGGWEDGKRGRCADVRMGWEEGRIKFSCCGPDLFSSFTCWRNNEKNGPAENIHILLLNTYMCSFYIAQYNVHEDWHLWFYLCTFFVHTVIQLMLLYCLWLRDVNSKYKYRLLNKSELKFLINFGIILIEL